MQELVKSALIGTARMSPAPCDSENAVDRLFEHVTSESPEKLLLLRAGAQSIAQTAGFLPQPVPPLEEAPEETGRTASPRMASLLEMVLSTASIPLLPEFLETMKAAEIVFPHRLLPAALNLQDPVRREKLRLVLGNRARWLAQFYAGWSWILTDDSSNEDNIQRLRTLWEDGTVKERASALQELRRIDPDKGREWLQESISEEKGDVRRRLVEQLIVGLSGADTPFLESLLPDRSKKVYEVIRNHLLKIFDSDLSQQICAQGAMALQMMVDEHGNHVIRWNPPPEFEADWAATGIASSSPPGVGLRSWTIQELLQRIPPSFWIDHFQMTPDEIIAGVQGDDFAESIYQGWRAAVVQFNNFDAKAGVWHRPLWDLATREFKSRGVVTTEMTQWFSELSQIMSSADLDGALCHLLRTSQDLSQIPFEEFAVCLPAPWSETLSEMYLRMTRRLFQTRVDAAASRWCRTLLPAAIGLSPACFASALEPWSVSADTHGVWQGAGLETHLQRFGEVIRTRREFREEVQSCHFQNLSQAIS